MKRIAIYVHYEKNGKVLDYERFFISELLKDFSKVIVVSNGEIDEHAMTDLNNVEIIKRENRGFDFGAWKQVIVERYESEIKNYDHLLITNNSVYGPIGSFSEMIAEMDKRNCDFWGINRHPSNDCCIIKGDDATRCYAHLQSYWIVFKSRLLHSDDFISYWRNLPELDTFKKAVGYGEVRLTHHFEQLGYCSDSFADFAKYSSMTDMNPCFFTYEQVKEDCIPVIKRKYFYDYFEQAMSLNIEFKAGELLEYLEENNLYNIEYIKDDLFRTAGFGQLFQSLDLFRCLQNKRGLHKKNSVKAKLFLIIKEKLNKTVVDKWLRILAAEWELIIVKSDLEYDSRITVFSDFKNMKPSPRNNCEPACLMVVNSLSDCPDSFIKRITEEIQNSVVKFKNSNVSEILACNSHLSLLVPFPVVSGNLNELSVYAEEYSKPFIYCYGKLSVVYSFAESFLKNEIIFSDGIFLETEHKAGEILNDNCSYAEYFSADSKKIITKMYYQLKNVHDSIENPQILLKIERQIKRIRRNNLLAILFWWKKEYYRFKNQRHKKMIDELLKNR